jgi:hypothetical protein
LLITISRLSYDPGDIIGNGPTAESAVENWVLKFEEKHGYKPEYEIK